MLNSDFRLNVLMSVLVVLVKSLSSDLDLSLTILNQFRFYQQEIELLPLVVAKYRNNHILYGPDLRD